VLAPGCLGLLDGAVGAELAEEVWTVLRRDADLGSALGALTRRYDLRSMPAFAVVVIDKASGTSQCAGTSPSTWTPPNPPP
jgi:hypothetical protein